MIISEIDIINNFNRYKGMWLSPKQGVHNKIKLITIKPNLGIDSYRVDFQVEGNEHIYHFNLLNKPATDQYLFEIVTNLPKNFTGVPYGDTL